MRPKAHHSWRIITTMAFQEAGTDHFAKMNWALQSVRSSLAF